jgi:ribonucleoside-diphosphate reductase alpha chain
VAPTANISVICGGVSAGIEPIPANVYIHKTLSGSFVVRNAELEKIVGSSSEVWDDILKHDGSVQHLEGLSDLHKDVFKTAFEIDQRWIIDLAADRTGDICQSQSVNLFLPPDIHKQALHDLHWRAWLSGVKSLYYVRSKSIQRATNTVMDGYLAGVIEEGDECLACQ